MKFNLINLVILSSSVALAQSNLVNPIAKCIQDKKCSQTDGDCRAACAGTGANGSGGSSDNSVIKQQECLAKCDPTAPIQEYQKCTNACTPSSSGGSDPNSTPTSANVTVPDLSKSAGTPTLELGLATFFTSTILISSFLI